MNYDVRVTAFDDVHELPEAWRTADYREILSRLDFDDAGAVADDEARELCHMALADLEQDDAARVVLEYRLGTTKRKGQIEDIAHDMIDEPLWEDYPDMSVHGELYNVNQLLYDAFNGRFPRPRAVRVELDVNARDGEGDSALDEPTDAFLVRLLAGGLPGDSALHRLFDDQLRGPSFPEAPFITWRWEILARDERNARFVVFGPAYWLERLENAAPYEAAAFSDRSASPEDD